MIEVAVTIIGLTVIGLVIAVRVLIGRIRKLEGR